MNADNPPDSQNRDPTREDDSSRRFCRRSRRAYRTARRPHTPGRADGDSLVFAHLLSNKTVATSFSPATNRSLKISVAHESSGPSDPAFTGDMVLKLFEDKAPRTTARIIQLAQSGFYNGLGFHRILNDFMIQGGDPLGNGTGGSGVDFDDEFDPSLQFTGPGLLAMAKSYDDTNDSQFFITEVPTRHLDFNHTIFGQLVEGEAVRQLISNVAADANGKPAKPVVMTSVSVIDDRQNGVLSLSVPNTVTAGSVDISVVARDPAGNESVARTFTATIAPDTTDNAPILGPVPDLVTRANTPVTAQLSAVDVDGPAGSTRYLNWVGLYNNFADSRLLAPDGRDPYGSVRDVDVVADFTSGLTTVTPKNNVAGVFPIYLGVAQNANAFDSQVVPLFVSPAAPGSIDLLDASDTGASPTDDLTRLNNTGAAGRLELRVNDVLPGATVKLFDGDTLLGQATVPAGATSVTITTNGTATLADGLHGLTATQTLANYAWSVGNRSGNIDLASLPSAALPVTIDTTPPTLTAPPDLRYQTAPHALTYTFSENVLATLTASDLSLRDLKTNVTIAADAVAPGTANQATFTFSVPGGVLPDGDYRATLAAAGVTDVAGNPLPAASTYDFFVLAGDANRDRTVGFADLLALAKNYGKAGNWSQGDFTGDGSVNFADLLVLAKAYNKSLPTALPAPVASFAASADQEERPAQALFSTTPVPAPAPVAAKPKAAARPLRR